jgi:hypothetical protein
MATEPSYSFYILEEQSAVSIIEREGGKSSAHPFSKEKILSCKEKAESLGFQVKIPSKFLNT